MAMVMRMRAIGFAVAVGMGVWGVPAHAVDTVWWSPCVAIRDDKARLACFDSSAPKTVEQVAHSVAPPTATVPQPARAKGAQPVSTMPSQRDPDERGRRHVGYRFAVGYGYGIGGHAGGFDLSDDATLRSRSGFGSEGSALSAQMWVDGWIADGWSLGLEYLYMNNSGKIDLNMPNGMAPLTDPVLAHAHAALLGHFGFLNVAYVAEAGHRLRPYIGGGVGIGWGRAQYVAGAENAFAGYYYASDRVSSPVAAVQGLIGMDIKLTRTYYISPHGRVVWIPGHPFGLDQRYLDFVFGLTAGKRF